jgi:tetratricopeptide (TPR) repeat protein
MGSYDTIMKIEQMRKHLEEGNLTEAQKILDSLEIKKVRNISDLGLIAEIYYENGRYEEAAELYQKIYDRSKTRRILYQLIEVTIRLNQIKEASELLEEYERIAPKDFYKYVFRYRIEKLKGEPYEKLIETLLTLKKEEYTEQWAYELAKTYYKAGLEEECIRECSDISLWFGEGPYVEKARMLKSYYLGETDKDQIIEELKRRTEKDSNDSKIEKISDNDQETSKPFQPVDERNLTTEDSNAYNDSSPEQTDNKENEVLFNPIVEEKELAEQEVENAIYQLLQEENDKEYDDKFIHIGDMLQLDLEEIFAEFISFGSIKEQLLKSIERILEEVDQSPHLIITGTENSGKSELAKKMALFLNKAGKIGSSKVAKISAVKLNNIDVMTKKSTLKDCCLVVDNAGELKRDTIESILELSQLFQGDIAVILLENKRDMTKLIHENPKIMDLFHNRIHLPD